MACYEVEVLSLISNADRVGGVSDYAREFDNFFSSKGFTVELISSSFEDVSVRYKLAKLPCESTRCMVLKFNLTCTENICRDIEWLYGKFRDKVIFRSSEFDYVRSVQEI